MINGVAGSIGGSLSFAIAARLKEPKAPIFAVLGDGTIGFHLAEFETAVRRNLPFVAILGNDACWNAESQIQLREYGQDRQHGCALTPARYDLAVAALGGHGELVETRRRPPGRDRTRSGEPQAGLHQRDDREHRGAGDPARVTVRRATAKADKAAARTIKSAAFAEMLDVRRRCRCAICRKNYRRIAD